ncbi:SRPBCC family protein [Bradyrhizobium oligotrophicum S58]
MARVYVSTVVNARNDRVWARVRDFNGLPNWHPAIAESRIEGGEPADKIGCVRDFRLRNGDRIREKLLGLSDYDMFCTYSILESPMGVSNYVATLQAHAGHGWRQDVPGMDRRIRLRARARGRSGRVHRRRRVPGRLRCAQARLRRLSGAAHCQEHNHRRAD